MAANAGSPTVSEGERLRRVRQDRPAQAHNKGVSAFVVAKDAPGFSRGRNENLLGLRGSPTTQLLFEDVRVPASSRLGEEGDGFRIAMTSLDEARLNCSGHGHRNRPRSLECAVAYARSACSSAKPIIQHQGLQFLLAESAGRLAAVSSLWETTMSIAPNRAQPAASTFAAMTKLMATDMAMRVTTDASRRWRKRADP